jgi:hypothetical protein
MSDKIVFASGAYFDRNDKAPDFVVGRLSVNVDKFVAWLAEQERSEKGYVNMQVLRKRDGSGYYVALDTWKPTKQAQPETVPFDDSADIPF